MAAVCSWADGGRTTHFGSTDGIGLHGETADHHDTEACRDANSSGSQAHHIDHHGQQASDSDHQAGGEPDGAAPGRTWLAADVRAQDRYGVDPSAA